MPMSISAWSKRTDAITNAKWNFVDSNGKPVDAITQIIDSNGFEIIIKEILNAKAWGYTMLEPKFFKNTGGKWEVLPNLIPRLNMRPEAGIVAYNAASDQGINIRNGFVRGYRYGSRRG